MSAKLKVTLLASSYATYGMLQQNEGTEHWDRVLASQNTGAEELVEFAGRACYQSWNLPNPKTATNKGYLENIIDIGHWSVLEHANFTFYIEGVSRSLTHELVRHRHFSFSQSSQRYCDATDFGYVIPPALRGLSDGEASVEDALEMHWQECLERYDALVMHLVENGAKRKEARQAARCVLPEMAEAKIVLTGNARTFREFLSKRNNSAADLEIQELAIEIEKQLISIAPNLFQNLRKENES